MSDAWGKIALGGAHCFKLRIGRQVVLAPTLCFQQLHDGQSIASKLLVDALPVCMTQLLRFWQRRLDRCWQICRLLSIKLLAA